MERKRKGAIVDEGKRGGDGRRRRVNSEKNRSFHVLREEGAESEKLGETTQSR
jgi:hypothetical protein